METNFENICQPLTDLPKSFMGLPLFMLHSLANDFLGNYENMECYVVLLFLVIATLAPITHIVQAQNQQGIRYFELFYICMYVYILAS